MDPKIWQSGRLGLGSGLGQAWARPGPGLRHLGTGFGRPDRPPQSRIVISLYQNFTKFPNFDSYSFHNTKEKSTNMTGRVQGVTKKLHFSLLEVADFQGQVNGLQPNRARGRGRVLQYRRDPLDVLVHHVAAVRLIDVPKASPNSISSRKSLSYYLSRTKTLMRLCILGRYIHFLNAKHINLCLYLHPM